MITVTETASKQMADILARNNDQVVRYELRGGGCSGLMAHWGTEPHYEPEEGDGQWTIGENRFFVIDKFDIARVTRSRIDDFRSGSRMQAQCVYHFDSSERHFSDVLGRSRCRICTPGSCAFKS